MCKSAYGTSAVCVKAVRFPRGKTVSAFFAIQAVAILVDIIRDLVLADGVVPVRAPPAYCADAVYEIMVLGADKATTVTAVDGMDIEISFFYIRIAVFCSVADILVSARSAYAVFKRMREDTFSAADFAMANMLLIGIIHTCTVNMLMVSAYGAHSVNHVMRFT